MLRSLHITSYLFVLSIASPVVARSVAPTVVVVPPVFRGSMNEGVRAVLGQRLALGLKAGRIRPVVASSAGASASCGSAACWRKVAARLSARYVVTAEIEGGDDLYRIALGLIDGHSGAVIGRVERKCNICGLKAVADAMELAANELSRKVPLVAGRSVARMKIVSKPNGASIFIDGARVGQTPLTATLTPGRHTLVARAPNHLTTRRAVVALDGGSGEVSITMAPRPANGRRRLKTIGWVTTAIGAAAILAGTVLLAVDGSETCDQALQAFDGCREELSTVVAGGITLGAGVGVAAAGLYLALSKLGRERPKEAVARRKRAVSLAPLGLGLAIRGAF